MLVGTLVCNLFQQEPIWKTVQLVKVLTEQGVPVDTLQTQAHGEEQNLSIEQLKQLLEQNLDLKKRIGNKSWRDCTLWFSPATAGWI